VIAALGVPPTFAMGTLRFSLGRWTTAEEIDTLLEMLPGVLNQIRRAVTRR
jgi:cysteine desulfurase